MELCDRHGVTQRALAEAAKMDSSNFSKAIQGKSGYVLRGPVRRAIAAKFNLTLDEFDGMWRGKSQRVLPDEVGSLERPAGLIPVINSAPAGPPVDYEEYGTDSRDGFRYIDRGGLSGDGLFAVIVVGSSMEPALHEGDEVVFRHVNYHDDEPAPVADGSVVYVCFGNDGPRRGCTIARWHADGESVTLTKDNPKHRPASYRREHIAQVARFVQRRTSRV